MSASKNKAAPGCSAKADPREGSIIRAIEREAKKRRPDLILYKTLGDAGTIAGTPDFLGAYKGRALAIEIKTVTGRLSPLQAQRLKEWGAAGALIAVCRSAEQFFRIIEGRFEDDT
jgi:hypothetical protein